MSSEKMQSLNVEELLQLQKYIDRILYYIGDVDCGPNDPERCKAAAACLMLMDWLPQEIEDTIAYEKEMEREREEFRNRPPRPDYITEKEYAKLHNKAVEVIYVLLKHNRIPGAIKSGIGYLIPEDAPYPSTKADVFKPFIK